LAQRAALLHCDSPVRRPRHDGQRVQGVVTQNSKPTATNGSVLMDILTNLESDPDVLPAKEDCADTCVKRCKDAPVEGGDGSDGSDALCATGVLFGG